jgi:hypothetical protein
MNWGRAWSALRRVGHATFYVIMGFCFIAFIVLGAISWVGRDRPTYWGTFTEVSTNCDAGPRGTCTSTGRWVSDDGAIVKNGITLDGSVERGTTVRANYQPGGPMGDDVNDIVHTKGWTGAGLWFPWVAAVGIAVLTWLQGSRWRRDDDGRAYSGRHSTAIDHD